MVSSPMARTSRLCVIVCKLYIWELGESTLQWPKNVVTNRIFQKCTTFNFHQTNIKEVFINYN